MKTVVADTILCVNDVSVNIDQKHILQDIKLTSCSGDLLAVMGASGSGKTTLLSTIAGRQPISSGDITLSGLPFDKDLRRRLRYVLQNDVFLSRLTLWETLYFTASIEMPDNVSKEEKISRIDEIVDILDIRKCLHTVMGDMFLRGLSGGERKRASIGCGLLTDPDILLLDEPTSGLDSSTAYSIMKSIKQFAEMYNKTVIVSIHQPSSQVYRMFDSLLLLSDGKVAYFGGANVEPLEYFDKLGHVCEENYNPADFYLEVLKAESQTNGYQQSNNSISQLPICLNGDVSVDLSKQYLIGKKYSNGTKITLCDVDVSSVHDSTRQRWQTSFTKQFKMLMWRSFKQSRGRILHLYDCIQYALLYISLGVLYFHISNDASVFRDRMGFLFIMVVNWTFDACIGSILAAMSDMEVVSKERAAGAYRLSAYYLAMSLSQVPLKLFIPTICYTFVYWMAGLGGVQPFFASWAVFMLSVMIAQGLGFLLGSALNDPKLAITTANSIVLLGLLFSGFVSQAVPWWLTWAKYISIVQYPLSAMSMIVLQDTPSIPCNSTGVTSFQKCVDNASSYITANDALKDAGIDLPIYCYIASMIIICCVLWIGVYLALRFNTRAPA